MKSYIFSLFLLVTFWSNSQDTLFTLDYPNGIITKKWEKSRSGKWFLVYPIDASFLMYKIPRSRMVAIHPEKGDNYSFFEVKNKRLLFDYDKRTARIFYSGAFSIDDSSKEEVFKRLLLFQAKESEVQWVGHFNGDSIHNVVKVKLFPKSEQREQRVVFYDLDLKVTGDSVFYTLSQFVDVNKKALATFDSEDKSNFVRLKSGICFLSEFYAQAFFSLDYWEGMKSSIKDIKVHLKKSVKGVEDIFLGKLVPNADVPKDISFNDVIVSLNSFEKKIALIEEDENLIIYYEKNNNSIFRKKVLKSDLYMLQKSDGSTTIYTHRRIHRCGGHFILDRNGGYFGGNIGGGYAQWEKDYKSGVVFQVKNGVALGLEFGYRFYFRSSVYRFTHGIHLGGRVDAVIGDRYGILSPTILLGYSGVLKLKKNQAIEFGLNVGPMFFIDDISSDSFISIILVPDIPVQKGLTNVLSVKYRFKHLYLGLEYFYGIGESVGLGFGTAERQTLSLSIGKVF